jgi:mono/diheme cytochrome c family protein
MAGTAAVILAAIVSGSAGSATLASAVLQDPAISTQRAVIDQYCVACHRTGSAVGERTGLYLDQLDLQNLGDQAESAEDILKKVRAGLMPPSGAPRPAGSELEDLAAWMAAELDRSAATHLPAPGLHRLNRNEYSNAIRDLLALEIDAADFLPSDDSSHGFDNMAGTLTMSPALMEAYLSAAGRISRLAVGTETAPTMEVFDAPLDTSQNLHVPGLPFGTRGGMLIEHEFPADGEYVFTVKGMTGYFQRVLGNVSGEQLEITVDGERVYLFDWDDEIAGTTGNGGRSPAIPISGGFHRIGVTFIATNDLPDTEMNRPFVRTMNSPGSIPGFNFYPHVGQVFLEGPFNGSPATLTRSREKVFICRPETNSLEGECAREIIEGLVPGAFRRPATEADITLVMDFYQMGREEGGNFDSGIEAALQRILADPEFIYRAEVEPVDLAEGAPYRVSDLELASRLSFFFWSSIPDAELLELAAAGRLQDPDVLREQVVRMSADPRARALVENFTGQWLNVRGMAVNEPVVELFPDFDSTLRDAYRREIELFFASIVSEDRSILELLTADYTFVNERLARHYGIPNVYGSQFRRVALGPDLDMRRGLLGKGALLTVTSESARTSPVKRGKWFLETFLGVSPPDPPPGVEVNVDADPGAAPTTLRQRMEVHRANPVCASCHSIFEPMGLALENFDAVGTWRTQEAGFPIDPTGVISDGTRLEGVHSLRQVLMEKSDQFAEVVIEKLLTYALGRGIEYQDMPTVRSIARGAADNDYEFSSILMGIVQSPAFQMNMTAAQNFEQQAAR